MDKNKNQVEDERYEFNSVKIAHELMVDILGGLIPGALFLFSIILCVVFPIICYANPGNKFGFLMKDGDWFWIVAFLSFLILSYVIGHIFYRADIKVPDRMDIRREQMKKLIGFLNGMPTGPSCNDSKDALFYESQRVIYSANLLLGEVSPLVDAMQECREDVFRNNPYDSDYLDYCKDVVASLKEIISNPEVFISRFKVSYDTSENNASENIFFK